MFEVAVGIPLPEANDLACGALFTQEGAFGVAQFETESFWCTSPRV